MNRIPATALRFWTGMGPWRVIVIAELLVGVAVVGIVAGYEQAVLTFFVVLGGVVTVVGVLWQRSQGAAQQVQLDRQARDIAFLADVARRQQEARPVPEVQALTADGPSTEFVRVRQLPARPDRDAILEAELGTLRADAGYGSGKGPWAGGLRGAFERAEATYQSEVNRYEENLWQWIEEMRAYLDAAHRFVRLPLRFSNRGALTLEDGEVVISLPEGVRALEEEPQPPGPPPAPPRRMFDAVSSLRLPSISSYVPNILPDPTASNISGPWPNELGDQVTYTVQQLLHGRGHEANAGDELLLAVAGDGEYELRWQIFARNMQEPESGIVKLVVRTDPPDRELLIPTLALLRQLYDAEEAQAS